MANKILIIEDDPFISKMYKTKLSLEGFEVDLAENGHIGISKVDSFQPELILLDLMMPDIEGFEVLRVIKGNDTSKNIPVLILSNLGSEDHIQKGKDMGAIGYLIKNQYTPTEVMEKIKSIFNGTYDSKK